MNEILLRVMNIAERIRNMPVMSTALVVIFGALAVFGIMNCVLGYRLLRFWMMLFGFILGAALGLGGVYTFGSQEKYMYIGGMLGLGVLFAVLAFAIYKAGIFMLGAGIGLALSIYVLHPTTSFIFFVCILIGVGLGALAMRWAKEVIIVGTSLLGGILAGISCARLGGLEEIPYGVGMSIGFALLGMLIQFATNKTREEEAEEEPEPGKERDLEAEEFLDDLEEFDDEWKED